MFDEKLNKLQYRNFALYFKIRRDIKREEARNITSLNLL